MPYMKEKSERTQCFRLFFCKWEDTLYMKKSVYCLAASISLLFAAFMLAGFAPQDDAARDMEELSRAIVKEDAEGLQKFGFDKAEVRRMEAAFLKRDFEMAKRPFPEDLIMRLEDAVFETAGKCEPRVKVLQADAGKATVEISFMAVDYRQIDMRKVMEGAWRSGDIQFKRRETMEDYVSRMTAALTALEPSDTKRLEATCVYDKEKGVWLPENPSVFIYELLELASGGGTQGDPAKDMERLGKAYLGQDLSYLEKLEPGSAAGVEKLHKRIVEGLQQKLAKDYLTDLTQGQRRRLAEAMMQAIKRVDVRAKTLHKEGEWADVEMSVSVIEPFSQKEQDVVRKRVPPRASWKEALAIFVDEMVSRLEWKQPSGTKTFQVKCVYYSPWRVWMPVELPKFIHVLLTSPLR